MNPGAYSPQVQALFENPRHAGSWDSATAGVLSATVGTPQVGQVLKLQIMVSGEQITDARFLAFGCGALIAVGSWLGSWLTGRSLAQARDFQVKELIESLALPSEKLHCALLAQDALAAVLQQG